MCGVNGEPGKQAEARSCRTLSDEIRNLFHLRAKGLNTEEFQQQEAGHRQQ